MKAANGQEQEKFREFYSKFFKKVYVFALRHTRDMQDAEDLAQEVFLKFWMNRASFSELIPADAQLLTIARQLVINRYKREIVRQKVHQHWYESKEASLDSENSDQLLLTEELSSRFQAALLDLPPKRRQIFEKSRIEGLSYDQIAQDLSISRSTVESQMVKALRLMREKLLIIFVIFFY